MIEKFFERVKLVLPEDSIEREPVRGLLERSDGQAAHANATDFFLRYQARLFEDAQVLHDGGHGDGVGPGQLADGGVAALQGGQYAAARRIAESGEGGVERG